MELGLARRFRWAGELALKAVRMGIRDPRELPDRVAILAVAFTDDECRSTRSRLARIIRVRG